MSRYDRIRAKRLARLANRTARKQATRERKRYGGPVATVQRGDSWFRLAEKIYGDQRYAEELINANRTGSGRIPGLQGGMVLRIPKVRKSQTNYFSQRTFDALKADYATPSSTWQPTGRGYTPQDRPTGPAPAGQQPSRPRPAGDTIPGPTPVPMPAMGGPGGPVNPQRPDLQPGQVPGTATGEGARGGGGVGLNSLDYAPQQTAHRPAPSYQNQASSRPDLLPGQNAYAYSFSDTQRATPFQRLAAAGQRMLGYLGGAFETSTFGGGYGLGTGQMAQPAEQRDRAYPTQYTYNQAGIPARPDLQPGQRAPETYSTYADKYRPGANPMFFGPGSGGIITPANAEAAARANFLSQAQWFDETKHRFNIPTYTVGGAQAVPTTQESGFDPGPGAYLWTQRLGWDRTRKIGGGQGYADLTMPQDKPPPLDIPNDPGYKYPGYGTGDYIPPSGGGGGGYGGGGGRPGGTWTPPRRGNQQRPVRPAGQPGYQPPVRYAYGPTGRPAGARPIRFNAGTNAGQRPVFKPLVHPGLAPNARARTGAAFNLVSWSI